ncbi:zinc metalloprotease HtpX [Candidatus Pacearchaeota archaeon CG_4_9_14_3_um_filter_31_7]|nr:MAG: hypothetical protein AUJ10_04030 [Candidatus Pacearchaeota archaeon CG1_02_31_27]PIN91929.1 MAG: zinc metalloprotease HtpX [Candidatus Pacearchaeota archaeon CG10_big_fil_rev_8_21_14_0_10_31_59]PIZ80488.1 MAG: zinc metalloprotease HtpX [Candidatus Pacearchaeota archaeon CG_4_10_14_0_2_um_filter_31_10]PJA70490.1 MAG: zinc metalloprotease HtpX [Candidatus Pacearchaeota archaeon CG_4_9_14_3_um_filter_31_7]
MQRKNFYDEISKNKTRSFILLLAVFIVLVAIGYAISFAFSPDYFILIMSMSIILSLIYVLATYYNSDKIALSSVKAVPADEKKYQHLHNIIEGLCIGEGIPKPKVYIMENENINAFASGRDPNHAIICVTTGTIKKLNNSELEGVLAHEISHIKNYDMRFMTVVAVVVGAIAIFSQIFLRSLMFGGMKGKSDSNRGGAAIIIFVLIGVALAILAPLIVKLVQLGISRKREFLADSSAAKLTRFPKGLANALKKIKTEVVDKKNTKQISSALAPLFISDPFKKKVQNLFSTHPPLEKRIEILEGM